jgi:hypothetical protein
MGMGERPLKLYLTDVWSYNRNGLEWRLLGLGFLRMLSKREPK